MSVPIGQMIGSWRIEASLGSGGMGQVYRATHEHLGRVVAVKILHDQFASDPTFQARFLQEAKAAAALEHPNIVQINDFSQDPGTGRYYLVMELVPDGSLRTLLRAQGGGAGGPLELPLGIDLIRQAAEGLRYAHDRGMVHRDIKPDNLLLRRVIESGGPASGLQVKITDFGLARLAEGGVRTADGTTMGTPAYMSPEQCQGVELDGRSDIYSLGVVLYEVATGLVPFDTKTLSDAVFKHVYTPPPSPREARPDLPEELSAIILRCLAKSPAERFATMAELLAALAALAPASPTPVVAATPLVTQVGQAAGLRMLLPQERVDATPGQPATLTVTLVNLGSSPVTAMLAADGPAAGWLALPPAPATIPAGGQLPLTLRVLAPRDGSARAGEHPLTLRATARENASWTAEATVRVAVGSYGVATLALNPAEARGRTRARYTLALRNDGNAPLDLLPQLRAPAGTLSASFAPPRLAVEPGSEGTTTLTLRAGGRWLGSGSETREFNVSAGDGPNSPPPVSGRFVQGPLMLFWVLPLVLLLLIGGGTAAALTFSGDDEEPAATATSQVGSATEAPAPTEPPATEPPATEPSVPTEPAATEPVVVPTATELPSADATATAEVVVPTEPVTPDLFGEIVFTSGRGAEDPRGNLDIWLMAADGSGQRPLIIDLGDDWLPAFSPDGSKLVFVTDRDGNDEVYVADADGTGQQRLTNDSGNDRYPIWSPDGTQILFQRGETSDDDLFVVDANGLNPRRLTNNDAGDGYHAWSPDGARIVWSSGETGNNEIWVMNADGSGRQQLTNDPGFDFSPEWSPDGSQIYFASNRAGDVDIYVMNADGGDATPLTTDVADDVDYALSPDGASIAFRRTAGGNSTLWVMDADGSNPRQLADGPWDADADVTWTLDGSAILYQRNTGNPDIWSVPLAGGDATQLTDNPTFDGNISVVGGAQP